MEEQQHPNKPTEAPASWDLNNADAYKQLNDTSQSQSEDQVGGSRSITRSDTFYFTHTLIGVGLTIVTGLLAKSAVGGNIAIALMTMGLIVYMPWVFGLYALGAFVVEFAKWSNRPK